MSFFVCSQCKGIENTALCGYNFRDSKLSLCSGCDPEVKKGWHNYFPKEYFNERDWEYYNGEFVQRKK